MISSDSAGRAVPPWAGARWVVVKIGAGQIRADPFCAPGFAGRGLPWLALGGCRTLHDGEPARGRDRGRGGGRPAVTGAVPGCRLGDQISGL